MKNKEQSRPPKERGALRKECDNAVSPVIGVMLMLVVVVIIAAVVSAFAGGMVGSSSNQKAPTLNMDVKIANSGNWRSTELSMDVTGVNEPIPTRDLKIVTSWTTTIKNNSYFIQSGSMVTSTGGSVLALSPGTVYHGGAVVNPGITNSYTGKTAVSVAPYGFGPGVGNITNTTLSEVTGMYNPANGATIGTVGPEVPIFNWQEFPATHFGNYSLEQGTVMMVEAGGRCIYYPNLGGALGDAYYFQGGYGSNSGSGAKSIPRPYLYVDKGGVYSVYTGTKTTPTEIIADGGQVDGMQAVLGIGWENLRAGDVVNMKVVHTPSGKTIFDKDIVVGSS